MLRELVIRLALVGLLVSAVAAWHNSRFGFNTMGEKVAAALTLR